ncbi:hypothetical protein ACHAO4_001338 [Trichoderma viride]
MASPLSSNSSAFLALPLEIRRQIYGLCIPQRLRYDVSSTLCYRNCPDWFNEISDHHHQGLVRGDATSIDNDGDDKSQRAPSKGTKAKQKKSSLAFVDDHRNALPALLLCCHQITEEVTDVLYEENTFQINVQDEDESILVDLLSPKTRQKIRKMVLIFRPRGPFYRRKLRMGTDIWDDILGNLQTLAVVIEQPEPYFEALIYGKQSEDVFADWNACITSMLEYICHALNREAKIVVDANDEQKTIEAIKEAVPERCHFQRLSLADPIFGRAKLSASAFWAEYWAQHEGDPITAWDRVDDDKVFYSG